MARWYRANKEFCNSPVKLGRLTSAICGIDTAKYTYSTYHSQSVKNLHGDVRCGASTIERDYFQLLTEVPRKDMERTRI